MRPVTYVIIYFPKSISSNRQYFILTWICNQINILIKLYKSHHTHIQYALIEPEKSFAPSKHYIEHQQFHREENRIHFELKTTTN